MNERDCANCKHHSEDGCSKWDCEFEAIDLISRADAIAYIDRVIKSGLGRYKSLDYIRKYISALPSADAEWIPIATEPNTSDHVLVTYKWDGDDYEASELDYWVTKYEAEKGNEKCKWLIDHVIAWMPLPAPYREGGEAE